MLDFVGFLECNTTYFLQFVYYRFLATGDSYSTIANSFRVGSSTIVEIIRTTCLALWDVLQPTVMRPPDQKRWLQIASDFEKKWQFPNCCGAIDGKHVVIKAPPKAGSLFLTTKVVTQLFF